MKTLLRVLSLAVLLTAFSALSFAQEPALADLYAKFRTEIKAKCGERDAAMATGKTIVEKFGADELNKEVIDYVKKKMAEIEKADPRCKLNVRYDAAFTAQNWSEFVTVSKAIMADEGDSPLALDVMLTLVSVGYDRAAVDKIDTFNNDTLSYAKTALQKLEAGKTSKTGKYGVFVPFNTKEAAQSWMNYIIGWQMYNKLNQKKDALGYLYKSTTVSTEKKNDPWIYTTIGENYFDEAIALDTKYRDARKANNNEDTDESKAVLGLARGNADRAIDAFGRAYKMVNTPAGKTAIGKRLTELYKFRFNLADAKQPDVDKYVSDLVAKPMPDPTTPVTPVVEEVKPATTSTTTSTTSTTSTTTPTNVNTTKPAAATVKSTTTTKTTTTATTTPKTPAKKPAPKKKGTR